MKEVFDVHKLDLQRVAKSFGFTVPPKINLGVKLNPKSKSSTKIARKKGI